MYVPIEGTHTLWSTPGKYANVWRIAMYVNQSSAAQSANVGNVIDESFVACEFQRKTMQSQLRRLCSYVWYIGTYVLILGVTKLIYDCNIPTYTYIQYYVVTYAELFYVHRSRLQINYACWTWQSCFQDFIEFPGTSKLLTAWITLLDCSRLEFPPMRLAIQLVHRYVPRDKSTKSGRIRGPEVAAPSLSAGLTPRIPRWVVIFYQINFLAGHCTAWRGITDPLKRREVLSCVIFLFISSAILSFSVMTNKSIFMFWRPYLPWLPNLSLADASTPSSGCALLGDLPAHVDRFRDAATTIA